MTTLLVRLSLLSIVLTASLQPLSVSALTARRASSSSASSVSAVKAAKTWGDYRGTKVYVLGKWTVEQAEEAVAFTRGDEMVRAITIGKDDCTYGKVRARAAAAWGVQKLEQKQGRIETLVLGRSDYKGFKWQQPDGLHMCLLQDAKSAVEVSVTSKDEALLTFANSNLIRQFAVRRAAR